MNIVGKTLQLFVLTLVAGMLLIGGSPITSYSKASDSSPLTKSEAVSLPEFIYNPAGRRDPFVPLVQKIKKTVVKPRKDRGPLEKFELSQLRLMALLIVQGVPRAMVKAPDGKSYTVKPGDLIGTTSGLVKRIETKKVVIDEASGQRIEKSPDRIVVEETGIDNYTGKEFKEYRYIQM